MSSLLFSHIHAATQNFTTHIKNSSILHEKPKLDFHISKISQFYTISEKIYLLPKHTFLNF